MINLNDDSLLQVLKPARYIGSEWNSSRKDFSTAAIKFAICFPDLYEVGMSNLGVRILYGILNGISDVSCERVFSPAADMENFLRNNKEEIFSLESRKVLKEFDLVGFSLGHELLFTNVLNILDLGGIPLRSVERGNTYPIIIGGGPCMLNPEPMHDFFDLFVIGEAEDVITEIIDLYRKINPEFRNSKIGKQEFLVRFSAIEGVYVPSLYELKYTPEGKVEEFKPKLSGLPEKIKKRFVRDLDKAYFPVQWIVPYIQIVHDRITLEIMRGCPNTCRFCQARQQYYPLRQRSVGNVLNLARETYKCSGYDEIAIGGLSVSDYSGIEELMGELIKEFKPNGISISLPSIKPKAMLGELSQLIATIKKTGLTFAPEAATQKMRQFLGKDFSDEDFFKTLEQSFLGGYQHVKLYFMIGLPFEEQGDLEGIYALSVKVSELRRKLVNRPAMVNISVNTLIPKPHTPFQWLGMMGIEEMKAKQDYLRGKISRNRRLKISFHNRYMSFIEGVLSRGDRRLSRVIEIAFKKGARFDAWEEHFSFERWMESFREAQIDPGLYLQAKSRDEILPWDFLDVGVGKERLIAEYDKVVDIK